MEEPNCDPMLKFTWNLRAIAQTPSRRIVSKSVVCLLVLSMGNPLRCCLLEKDSRTARIGGQARCTERWQHQSRSPASSVPVIVATVNERRFRAMNSLNPV